MLSPPLKQRYPRFRRLLRSADRALSLTVLGVLCVLAGCRSRGSASETVKTPINLIGVSARCTSVRGTEVPADPPVTLIFETGSRVSGSTGLNAYTCSYQRDEDPAISFGRIGSTRMAGSQDAMLLEADYLSALAGVDRFELDDSQLQLFQGEELVLSFQPLADDFDSAERKRRLHGDDWPPATAPEADWIKMNSGEWLKGEIESLTRGSLSFDSDELDELNLSYEDISEIHTKRLFTVVFDDAQRSTFADKPEAIGQIHVEGDTVFVKTEDDTQRFRREDLYLMVPGEPKESNYWSGKALLGIAVRSGNTEQTDVTLSARIKRRTANSRVEAKLDTVFGEQNQEEIANNQRLTGTYDVFLSRRFFLTPFGFELYRDRFQNIELRSSPYIGVGYTIFDRPKYEHDVTFAVGYRSTRFDSAPPGGVDRIDTGTANVGTTLSADLTAKVELVGSYGAQVSVEDTEDTNQNAFVGLSFDIWKDFDLDVRANWNRVGRPEPSDDGTTPKKDDLRIDVGFSWSF